MLLRVIAIFKLMQYADALCNLFFNALRFYSLKFT